MIELAQTITNPSALTAVVGALFIAMVYIATHD